MEQNGGQFEKLADVALQELRRVFDKMNGEEVEQIQEVETLLVTKDNINEVYDTLTETAMVIE